MCPIVVQWLQVISQLVVILTALVALVWWIWRYRQRPQFIVGAPPTASEQARKNISSEQLGQRSIINEFRHNRAFFATKLKDKEKLSDKDRDKLYKDTRRCRNLTISSSDNQTALWLVVQNVGGRAAREYLMSIEFRTQGVHVLNVLSESLKVDCLYLTRPELVTNEDLRPVDSRVVAAYDDYMQVSEPFGDEIFLKGTLESGQYEMIYLEISLEPEVERFEVVFSLDCTDFWFKKEVVFQGFIVRR